MPRYTPSRGFHNPLQAQLRERRRAVGIFSFSLAELASMPPWRYSRIESGQAEATPDEMRAIDDVLHRLERAMAPLHKRVEAEALALARG